MRRVLPACAVSAILAGAVSPVLAGPRIGGPFGTDGSFNVYELITTPMTWDQARVAAAGMSFNGVQGHLVSIHSADENNFVRLIAGGDWWIGLTDSDVVSTLDSMTMPGTEAGSDRTMGWAWVSGEPYTFEAWGGGEPNDAGGSEDAAHKRGDGLWNDHQAGSSLGQADQNFRFIVEYPTNSPTNPAPIGLLPGPQGGFGTFGVREVTNNNGVGDLPSAEESQLMDRSGSRRVIEYQAPVINLHDSGGNGNFGNDSPFASAAPPDGPGVGEVNDISILATGKIRVTEAGTYTFNVNSDDGFRLVIAGQQFTSVAGQAGTGIADGALIFPVGRGSNNSLGHINLPAGDHDIQLLFWEGGGGATVELSVAPGEHTSTNLLFNLVGAEAFDTVRKAPTVLDQPGGWDVVVLRDDPEVAGNAGASNLGAAIAQIENFFNTGTAPGTVVSMGTASVINFVDPQAGGGGKGFPQNPFPGDTPDAEDNFAMGARARIEVTEAGEYTFMILGDDGSRFRILGSSGWEVAGGSSPVALADGMQLNGCCSDGFGFVTLAEGEFDLELIWNEIGGGAYVGLWAAMGRHESFGPEFQLLGENINEIFRTPAGLQLVPEPSTFGLLGIGALAMLRRSRRSR